MKVTIPVTVEIDTVAWAAKMAVTPEQAAGYLRATISTDAANGTIASALAKWAPHLATVTVGTPQDTGQAVTETFVAYLAALRAAGRSAEADHMSALESGWHTGDDSIAQATAELLDLIMTRELADVDDPDDDPREWYLIAEQIVTLVLTLHQAGAPAEPPRAAKSQEMPPAEVAEIWTADGRPVGLSSPPLTS
jgi:hypothetical protein